VVLILFPPFGWFYTFVVKYIFSILMIMTAFGFGGLQNTLANIAVFYVINFAVAGGIIGTHYLLQTSGDVMNGIWFTRSGIRFDLNTSLWFIAVMGTAAAALYLSVFRSAKRKERQGEYLAEVTIRIDQFESHCTGLIDTGNGLYDPLTRTPVMIVEANLLEHKLPESWLRCIRSSEVEHMVSLIGHEAHFDWQDRLRLVPYRGINRGTQFMLAIKPDQVVIAHKEQKVEANKVLIGMDGGKLSADGTYQALIHPVLMQG